MAELPDWLGLNQWTNPNDWQDPYQPPAAAAAPVQPATSTTPNGIPKVPGFNNPYNPYDTGRHGEQNRELNNGQGGKVDWWDYDLAQPMPGVGLGADGFYAGGGGGGGGGAGGLFDPILAQLKTDLAAQGTADLASRDSAIKRAIGLFGDPNLDLGAAGKTLGFDLGSIIDPQTQALSKQSYESGVGTQARIDKANKDALRQIRQALAARGALRSGELGHQLSEQQGRYTNAQFDARQALLDMLSGYQKGYLEGERMRQSQYFNALMAGASRAQSGGGGGGGAAPPTGRTAAWTDTGPNSLSSANAAAGLQALYDQQQQKKVGQLDPWAVSAMGGNVY